MKVEEASREAALYLSLDYNEDRRGGKPESDEPYSSRSPTYVEVSFHSLSRGSGTGRWGSNIEVSREIYEAAEVYVVIVRYQDGDSFGTSHGNWCVAGVATTAEEARKIEAAARLPQKDHSHYREWDGYFSGLEEVEIHAFRVRDALPAGGEGSSPIRFH